MCKRRMHSKKLFRMQLIFLATFQMQRDLRSSGRPSHWHISTNKNQEIERLNEIYERLLVNSGVHIIRGHASRRLNNPFPLRGTLILQKIF